MKLNGATPHQIRAARALLGWSQADLAKNAGISVTVIARIELAAVDARISTIMAILNCLEANGIEFITTSDGSVGAIRHPV